MHRLTTQEDIMVAGRMCLSAMIVMLLVGLGVARVQAATNRLVNK
jgi:hypothetical protein